MYDFQTVGINSFRIRISFINWYYFNVVEVKKNAQELYGLINYGELRKKSIFVNDKALFKLVDLVYKGSVTLRVKGKNIKLKTPSCKALRELNQVEGEFKSIINHCLSLTIRIFYLFRMARRNKASIKD